MYLYLDWGKRLVKEKRKQIKVKKVNIYLAPSARQTGTVTNTLYTFLD